MPRTSKTTQAVAASAPAASATPAASQSLTAEATFAAPGDTGHSAVIRLLVFAMSQRQLHKLGDLRRQFDSVHAKAKESRPGAEWPTRSQFDRATSGIGPEAMLRAVHSTLERQK